jgi:hypothetical protein
MSFAAVARKSWPVSILEIAYEQITYAWGRDSLVGLRCYFGIFGRPAVSAGELGQANSFVAGYIG